MIEIINAYFIFHVTVYFSRLCLTNILDNRTNINTHRVKKNAYQYY